MKFETGTVIRIKAHSPEYDVIKGFESNFSRGSFKPSYIVDTYSEDGELLSEEARWSASRYHEWLETGKAEEVNRENTPLS